MDTGGIRRPMQKKRTIEQIKGWFSREDQAQQSEGRAPASGDRSSTSTNHGPGPGGRDVKELRQELSEKNGRVRQMREQLKTNRLEAARLDELHQRRLAEKDATISGLKGQLYNVSSDKDAGEGGESGAISEDQATALYLDLMKRSLTNWIYRDEGELYQRDPKPFEDLVREEGRDWPLNAHTMVGLKRLDNLQSCVEDVIANRIPGDLIETGVWRGGATILMRAVLKAHGVEDRRVWVADSFEGMPAPDPENYPHDARFGHFANQLAVSLEQVKDNFDRYSLLDGQVRFLKGWFRDTLPTAPIDQLAVVRLDGDWYESTMDGLENLYPKLSVGGYLIVDDYGCVPACRQAVQDYREAHGIADEIHSVDWTGVFWQRTE